ncbi:unnamed protein product [Fusarium equiseti]|uniref:RelA/SpoT domain-containing protein n=1 Tax=Fusarium equiseti TaxID=61235 RepID=A0A8J2NDJ8_FUSEQ|nr:unnamed protein product [Fusarium equiseti]
MAIAQVLYETDEEDTESTKGTNVDLITKGSPSTKRKSQRKSQAAFVAGVQELMANDFTRSLVVIIRTKNEDGILIPQFVPVRSKYDSGSDENFVSAEILNKNGIDPELITTIPEENRKKRELHMLNNFTFIPKQEVRLSWHKHNDMKQREHVFIIVENAPFDVLICSKLWKVDSVKTGLFLFGRNKSKVETFLKVWPRLEPHYGTMVEQLKNALEGALSVQCTVSARVKSLSSITKSIERRQIHQGKQFKEVHEIFDDLHDLAGFRIVVDYPSGIQIVKAFITKNFQLKSTNVFKADREVPDALTPTFPSFQNESHHVVLHPNAEHPLSPFCDILFEIQILSLAESLYNRLAHPLLDKKSSGQLSIKEQKMIEVTHGLSLCYWICLSCMEDRLVGKESQEIPIPIQKAAQLDGDQITDMESFVKATPYSMPASGERISIEKCLDSVKDLSKQAMSSDQLHSRLSVLLNGSTQTTTTNANYGSGHIVQNYGSGSNNHSNNTYNSAGGNITFAKEDTEDEIRNTFWVTDPQSHKEDIQERKGGLIKGSYLWILKDEHFTKWYDQEFSLLWLNGDPGKGKTMSVCGIIDHINVLSVRVSKDSKPIVSYFFCDASDSNLNNATSVLRGIVYSIIFQNSMALSYVRERFKELSKPLSHPKLAWPVLKKIFIGIFSSIKDQKTYLIIDALDECKEGRVKLLEFIVEQSSLLPIKWIVSSRKWPVIKEILTTCPKLLELRLENNEADVSAAVGHYISHQVETLSKVKGYDPKRKKAVEHHLRSKSNDTFLWISFVCRMLKGNPGCETMKRLDEFPAGLDALYGRMLEQIQPSSGVQGDLYARMISFALGAFRPLCLDELYHLVDDQGIAVKEFEDIVALCGSFLTVKRRQVGSDSIHNNSMLYSFHDHSGICHGQSGSISCTWNLAIHEQCKKVLAPSHINVFIGSLT